ILLKADGSGVLTWVRSYGGTSMDEAKSVVELPGNGYAIGGNTSDISGFTRMHVIRTDGNGALTWDRSYRSDYGNVGNEIIATTDGGFAIVGDVWNTFGNQLADLYQATDAYFVKTDASGNSFGCQTNSTGLTSLSITAYWSGLSTTLTVGSGNTANTPTMQESPSLTNVYDAAIIMSFDVTSVLCDTVCAGAVAVDMCDSNGFYCSGVAPYSYAWSANTGSQTGVTATGLCGGTYQVTVTDASDCSGVGEAVVTSTAVVQDICVVTVDSTSTYNSVVWEKPTTVAIDSFRVYRDIVGTYTHIGSLAYGALSEFVDNTNGVSPTVTSYRYKVSTVDTCGNESALSPYHETIHLTVSLGTPPAYNLIWDNYEGISFLYYRILRDSVGNGEFGAIDSVTASNFTYTDPSPPAGNMVYAIEVVHPNGCTADKVKNFNSSKSNTSTAVGGGLNASIASNDATPGNCDGNATVTATGGTSPYTYVWSTSPVQTTSIATGLCVGTYTVTVTDNAGDSVISSVLINESTGPLPVAQFTSDKTTVSPGDSVNFIDLSSNTPTSWSWIFTNGTPSTSSEQNPDNIVYNVNGCHDVTLIATNGNGSGNITKTCYIQVGATGLDNPGTRVFHSLAPNPFEHSTVLRYISRGQERVVVRVFDLLGELVYSFEGFSNGGENEVEWSTMYPGVYILNARIGDRFISEKVIKL
ncbi:MAG TPA: T9SS type A sorting domain-containing protein, partial [Flavobacteriales bacterium]|nr:T9SS type A sorting domain-containing protein [Flavobacteriales bacterium]